MVVLIQLATTLLTAMVVLLAYRTYKLSRSVWCDETADKNQVVTPTRLSAQVPAHDGQRALKSYLDDLF